MRYTPFELPNVAYVPGQTNRPKDEPLEKEGVEPLSLSCRAPFENEFFLFGIDLFNHHFFWEAHEAWETIWHLEEDPALRNLIQGLIQLSGGYLKIFQNNDKGARTLWGKASKRLTIELLDETGIDLSHHMNCFALDNGISQLSFETFFAPVTMKQIMPLL